ncbi:MAG: hypothetical protein ACK4N4_00650 [Burkholderiales bacterium]
MSIFGFTPRKRVDETAKKLAREFFRLCPPAAPAKGGQPSEKKIESALAEIYKQAKAFRRENRLGVLNRARFAKVFQDELAALGYPSESFTKVTTALVINALSGD